MKLTSFFITLFVIFNLSYAQNTTIKVNPDGSHTVVHNNGNNAIQVNPDGSHTVIHNNGNNAIQVNPDGSHTVIQKSWMTFMEDNYSIRYPENWDLDTLGMMGTKFILFSQQSSEDDIFKENVNLIIQDISSFNMNLDQYVEMSEQQVKTLIEDSELLVSKRIKKKKTEYHKVIYTGKQGVLNLKFEQYCWLIDGAIYLLTLTCEETNFDAFQATGEKILDSFKVRK